MRARAFAHAGAWLAGAALAACSQPAESSAQAAQSVSPATTLDSVTPVLRERAVFAAG